MCYANIAKNHDAWYQKMEIEWFSACDFVIEPVL